MKERELIAYKVWKCKLCGEIRQDSGDMASHMHVAHGTKSLENDSTHMYAWVKK